MLRSLAYLFCALLLLAATPPPALTPRDTKGKIQEILKAHVCHQKLSPELMKRALMGYIDELDPARTYFLEGEVASWENPSDELAEQALQAYINEDFKIFFEMHGLLVQAIQRRQALEPKLKEIALPDGVTADEFKEPPFAKTEEELLSKLSRIRALQFKTSQKIQPEEQEQFFQRLAKRRSSREQELLGTNKAQREQIALSYVLKAVSESLDSQTAYFTPHEANQFMMQVQQKLFGIGARLRDDLNGFTIMELVEGSPATLSNALRVGDKIIAVNTEPVVGMDIVEAVSLIRGPQGSTVSLTLLRDKEEPFHVELVRGEIVLTESRFDASYEPYGEGVVAVLKLFSFYQDQNSSSASDLRDAFRALQKEHKVQGVILDLRQNGGGLLPQAVAVAGLFLNKGVVVSIKDNTGETHHLRNVENRKIWDGPLLVLTSRASASAAEIVAGALQDYGRALVVGDQKTYGKGTFQTFTLEASHFGKVNPKGEYKVTRGRYYTVSGKSPQLVGVQADIVAPSLFHSLDVGEQYGKYPVGPDEIEPHFIDDFSDVPIFHRISLQKAYATDKQEQLTTYVPYLTQLKSNSEQRIQRNKNYQNFLTESAKEELSLNPTSFFGQNDLQLEEAVHIMKDTLYLMEKKAA